MRASSIFKLVNAGGVSRIIVSHDSVWYWVGGSNPCSIQYANWKPTNFFERVIPMLEYEGVTDEDIEVMLKDNPQRFFAGDMPEPVK